MVGGLEIGEDIVFGGLMDLGSKVKKCKEHAGIGVKYPVIRDAPLITRVTAFKKCVFKDGKNLMLTLTDTVGTFNNEIKKLRARLGHLFLVDLIVLLPLSLQNMESLGVDVALMSKVKMINKRILEGNPRCIVHHCGNHRTALVSSDTLRNSERHKLTHDISCKLYDLVNASSKFEDLFRQCQILTHECD